MTVSTLASQQIALGNGVTTVFSFSFIAVAATDIQVTYTDADGVQDVLSPSQYTLFLNPAATNSLWGIGGTCTYPLTGDPIADGTFLTIQRIVPLVQTTSISNQGAFYTQAVETALDTLCFEIQQVSGRTGAIRGSWATDVSYNYADIVQDGTNGTNTLNYYMCAVANISDVWADDLEAGYWSLAINIQQTSQFADDAEAAAAAAAVSAAAALVSQSSASSSASAASASAVVAAASESSVAANAAIATTGASTATTQAGLAAVSASSAATSASTATTQANTATAQAATATTQAGLASTYASAASASATSAQASALAAAGTRFGTSVTSNSIGTGAKTFTTQASLGFLSGMFIVVTDSSNPSNYIHGQVTSYSGTTLVVDSLDTGGSGTLTSWNIAPSGPQGSAGAGSGTVNSGTAGRLTYYAGSGTTVSDNANLTVSTGALTLGQATSVQGSLVLSGSTSGTTTLAASVTGSGTMTLPAATDTIVGKATTDIFTNKTITDSSNVLGGVTMTLGSDAEGDVYYRNSSGILTRLAAGGANVVLRGSATVPAWGAVSEAYISLTDVTTNNVTSTKHGFAPKSGADATTFLNGAATPAFAAVKDSDLSTSDITTNNATAAKHGFCPKLSGNAAQFLDGSGAFSAPAGAGGLLSIDTYTASDTWTKPAGCTSIEVWVVGGGGGGGTAAGAAGTSAAAGAGGGGGGYSYKYITSGIGTSETVTIGAGGSTSGGGGGTTSFGSHCSATGGAGGTVSISDTDTRAKIGGAGGVGSSGSINGAGAAGQGSWFTVQTARGIAMGGGGGSSMFGGGAVAPVGSGTAVKTDGNTGGVYGGGGSGGIVLVSNTGGAGGGAGAAGVVIVKAYL